MQKTWKRFDTESRIMLQACLNAGMSRDKIAFIVGFSLASISREINRNSTIKPGADIPCTYTKTGVCNKCKKNGRCNRRKIYYDYKEADKKSKALASSTRSKIKISIEDLKIIDEIVSAGVSKGQSLHHIYVSNPILKKICCERTIRRLVYRGAISVKACELRMYVRYKHTYKKDPQDVRLRDIRVLIGRSYKDYLKRIKAHPKENIVQYDSLIGKRDDKQAILTITFPKYGFQFGILIKKNNPEEVTRKIRLLFKHVGDEKVKEIFPVNLADNGVEFSYFDKIEFNMNGEVICSSYFTSPYKATDKAECERLHSLVRYVLPKGRSFDSLTQEQVNELYSHINSYVRKSKNDQTPYDLVRKHHGVEFLDAIGIKRIPKKKVRLQPII